MEKSSSFKDDIVRSLATILDDKQLTEIEYEVEGCRIRVARQWSAVHTVASGLMTPTSPISTVAPIPEIVSEHKISSTVSDYKIHAGAIKSPMVGTAYMSASPGSAPFTTVGDKVIKGQTLMIIEAMKVMNQIKAHQDGIIKNIFVKDADPIEYDQVLIVLE